MTHPEILLVGLFVAIAFLSAIARALSVPYPIALVLGGLVLGFIPGIPDIRLQPDLVLVLFLPPLLYASAFFASLRDLRADLRTISLLAVGLVLATMVAVAAAAHAVVGLPWAAAFALGAVVSPTDAVAATTVMRRVGAPRRTINVLEGESLVNDATALVAYRVAVAAAVTGGFSAADATGQFFASAAGGVAIGLAVGFVISEIRRRLDDATIETTISLLSGYAAYVPAERAGVSGVLAAVTTGIYVGWRAPRIASAAQRVQGRPVWEILVFLLNATLFLLVGLQLHAIVASVHGHSTGQLVAYGALVSAVVVAARIVWVFTITVVIRTLDRRPNQRLRRASWRLRLVNAWSGMRGAVSLAAALAIPLATDAGAPFPDRSLIVFLTFAVILATLVVQGLSLPWLIRALGISDDGAAEREELHARLAIARAALDALDDIAAAGWAREDSVERMRNLYGYRKRRFAARAGKVEDDGYEERSTAYQRMVHAVLDAQRLRLVELRDGGTIANEVMIALQRELDLEESRLEW